ncbi:Uncharacterised protein [Mycobacterium tuberculosis]|nr:Uncharacterised protein [Mycobacterium tuberculosis]
MLYTLCGAAPTSQRIRSRSCEVFVNAIGPEVALLRQLPRTYEWAKCQYPTFSRISSVIIRPIAPESRIALTDRQNGVKRST